MRAVTVLGALVIGSLLVATPPAGAQTTSLQGGSTTQPGIVTAPPRQPGARPPRDNQQQQATGTSRIRGRVTAADSGQPLRRAMVRVMSPDLRQPRVAETDNDGRYEIKDLPAGRYSVSFSKDAYAQLNYGQRRPGDAGRQLQLADNEIADRIDAALQRGGVITGRVVDEFGEPFVNAMVQAQVVRTVNAERRPMPIGPNWTTSDTGEFRLWGLASGEYIVSVTTRAGGMNMEGFTPTAYPPLFYPGTPNAAEAQVLTIASGQTLNDIVVMLVPAKMARLSGTVSDLNGRPVTRGFVNVMPRRGFMGGSMPGAQIQQDGTFIVNNVPSGSWMVRASMPNEPGSRPQMAQAEVTVFNEDIAGIILQPVVPISVKGRITTDAAARALPLSAFQVSAQPMSPDDAMFMGGMTGPPPAVKDDGSFEISAAPGRMRIQVFPNRMIAGAWMLKAVYANGEDVTDAGIEFRAGESVRDLVVEITGSIPRISGAVRTSRGEVAADYTVLVFPQDRQQWTSPAVGRMGFARPDQNGGFEVRNLRPGDYFIVAVETTDNGAIGSQEFRERLAPVATRLSITGGDTKTVDLILQQPR